VRGLLAALLALGACASAGRGADALDDGAEAGQRNGPTGIVVIYADDLGYGDVACFGGETSRIPTPRLDALAAEGLAFEERLRLGHVDAGFCSQYGSTHSKGTAGRDEGQVPWAKVKVTGLELLGDMGADGCFGFGRQRRVFIGDKALGQSHGTELEGEGLLDDAPLETDQFEAATPDVRLDEAGLPRDGGIAGQA